MGSRFKILFVDDEPGLADLTATFVEREDDRISTVTATNVEVGLERLAEHDVDCIVSDYDMPQQNGLKFLGKVRDRFGSIPFILYTGKGSEEIASKAFSAGANDYFQKKEGPDQYTLLANIITNLVEKHHAEREKERNLEVMETAQEGLSIVSKDGTFEYVNQAYTDTFGYDQSELVGRSWSFLYPEEDVEHVRYEVIPTIPDDGVWSGETTFLRSDGTRIIANHTLARARGDRLICTVRDITEALEREEELQERRTLLDLFIQKVEEYAIFTLDPDGHVTTWNSGAERITGYEADEILGEPFSVFFTEFDREEGLPNRLLARAEAEGIATHEGRRRRKDGSTFWEDVTISAIRDDEGALVGFGNVVYDATKEQTDQQRQRATERKIRRLHDTTRALVDSDTKADVSKIAVDALQDTLNLPLGGCWLYDAATETLKPVAATARSEELLGGLPTFERGDALAWQAFESGEPMTFDGISAHPDRHNPETTIRSELILPLESHGVLVIGSTAPNDFTESDSIVAEILAENTSMALDRVERQTQLNEERAFIESALDHLTDTFYVFSPDGSPIRWNSQLPTVTGYTDEEIAEMHVLDFFEGDDKGRVADAVERIPEAGETEVTADVVTKNGERIPYKFTGARLTDSAGEITGLVGIGRDISDQKECEAELERRNERLEELSSVLSHDLRSPLNVAQRNLEMVQETGEMDRLEYVERALQRMNTLIEDLLVLARQGRVISTTTDIQLAAAAERAWEHVESRDASLTVTTERTLLADETRLLQLLENLLRNAVEHGSTGSQTQSDDAVEHGSTSSRPSVDDAVEHGSTGSQTQSDDAVEHGSTSSRPSTDDAVEHGGPDVAVRIGDLPDGFYVEDMGPGFPETVREQFENGDIVEGHLGLRIVRTISDAHGWDMRLTESENGGSRVEFRVDGANDA